MKHLFSLFLLCAMPLSSFAKDLHFPESFLFGVATAPGQSEDQLDDIWMEHARASKIRAFTNTPRPFERLRFWSAPEVEINLAAELGSGIFRLGVDWGRLHTAQGVFDQAALVKYKALLEMIKKKKMKVMLTLFHFSIPKWVQDQGGWVNPKTSEDFLAFSKVVAKELAPLVDYWITFNEPQVFTTMGYTLGIFPPGKAHGWWSLIDSPLYQGDSIKALHHMAQAHNDFYHWMHAQKDALPPRIGIAQHMGFHTGKTLIGRFLARFSGEFMNWYFPELIRGQMDYFGFNYYGAEWVGLSGISTEADEEYSEAGRAIYPTGLYHLSKEIQKRFAGLPLFVTENGIGDSTDWLRPSYHLEHLVALKQLLDEGVPLLGYIFWTLTDNLEWSDGYCPKFGLMAVDRHSPELTRIKRPSFFLFQDILTKKRFTLQQREDAWKLVQENIGKPRPYCRAEDEVSGLDVPVLRKIVPKDWRFQSPEI